MNFDLLSKSCRKFIAAEKHLFSVKSVLFIGIYGKVERVLGIQQKNITYVKRNAISSYVFFETPN